VDIVQTAAVWGVTHFLRVAALAHAHDLPVSPVGTTPVGLVHAATAVPNHIVAELQDLTPPVGLTLDMSVEDGGYVLGESPGLGIRVDESAIAAAGTSAGLTGVEVARGPHVRPEHAARRLLPQPVAAGDGPT
jgi:L-alanine-DL-glutamate epimerase-like enolase superfamily enzyme